MRPWLHFKLVSMPRTGFVVEEIREFFTEEPIHVADKLLDK